MDEQDKNQHEDSIANAMKVQTDFRMMLDTMDGMISEAMRHGWSKDEARDMVRALFTGNHQK